MNKDLHKLNITDPASLLLADDDSSAAEDATAIPAPPNSPDPLEGQQWSSTNITYSFATSNLTGQLISFSSFITNSAYQALVEKAAALWSAVSGITMQLVPDSAATDVRVGFETFDTAATDQIGQTNYRYNPSSEIFAPGITVGVEDPAQVALSATPDGDDAYAGFATNLFQDIVHELGHSLGLNHNTVDAAAEMNPTLTASNRSIDPNDAAAIEQLYGGSSTALAKIAITGNGSEHYDVATGGTFNPFAGLVVTDGAGLHEVVTVTVTGGGTLTDPTAGTDARFIGGVFTESADNLTATDYAQSILNRLVFTVPTSVATASLNVEVDNSLQGSASAVVTVTADPTAGFRVTDTTTGQSLAAAANPYVGPVAGLQEQYINVTADSLNIAAATPNWFLHSGSGEDAISVSSGINVLDGGTGSNFLNGGSGTDTFFVDVRGAAADIWSTLSDFHAGDSATIWGVTPSSFALAWADGQGAAGYTGLTLHAAQPASVNASLTLAGLTSADLSNGRLSVSYGTDSASGSAYMQIHANH